MRAVVTIAVLSTVAACEPGAARVSVARDRVATPNLMSASPVEGKSLRVSPISAVQAEDGHGHRVTVLPDPRALDVHAPSWPGRALDPVLYVGELHFEHYEFPSKEVMRFVVDDVARLHAGDRAWMQWGDDEASRLVLTSSLEVPK